MVMKGPYSLAKIVFFNLKSGFVKTLKNYVYTLLKSFF